MQKNSLQLLFEKLLQKGIYNPDVQRKLLNLDDFILELLADSPLDNFFEKVEVALVDDATYEETIKNIILLDDLESIQRIRKETFQFSRIFAARIFRDKKIKMKERQSLVEGLIYLLQNYPLFSNILTQLGEFENENDTTTHLLLITLIKNTPFLESIQLQNPNIDPTYEWYNYITKKYNDFVSAQGITKYNVEKTITPSLDSDLSKSDKNTLIDLIERINSYVDKDIDKSDILTYLSSTD